MFQGCIQWLTEYDCEVADILKGLMGWWDEVERADQSQALIILWNGILYIFASCLWRKAAKSDISGVYIFGALVSKLQSEINWTSHLPFHLLHKIKIARSLDVFLKVLILVFFPATMIKNCSLGTHTCISSWKWPRWLNPPACLNCQHELLNIQDESWDFCAVESINV